jgi:hypothetical protein
MVLSIQKFVPQNKIPVFPQSLYGSDLSAADFLLYVKLKVSLKGCQFGSGEEILKKC